MKRFLILAGFLPAILLCTVSQADHVVTEVLRGLAPARTLSYEVTHEIDPSVIEEEEATDPEAWWAWFDTLPVDHGMTLSQKELVEWLEWYGSLTEEQKKPQAVIIYFEGK